MGVADISLATILKAFLSLPIDCLIVGLVAVLGVAALGVAVLGVVGRVFFEVVFDDVSFFSNVNVSSRFS